MTDIAAFFTTQPLFALFFTIAAGYLPGSGAAGTIWWRMRRCASSGATCCRSPATINRCCTMSPRASAELNARILHLRRGDADLAFNLGRLLA